MSNTEGKLYVVATPIGNLSDLSERARQTLATVDRILVEDTRHSGKLLKHLMVSTPMQPYHDHNERDRVPGIIEQLQSGKNIALISDAGTPLINDPGFHLVSAAHSHAIQVIPIPGPSALIAAFSVSGLNSDNFSFQGFLAAKQSERLKRLSQLERASQTQIFYEAPHRILASLEDCMKIFGNDRSACIVREMTKLHEDVRRASLSELHQWLQENPEKQKGEFVLLIEGQKEIKSSTDENEAIRILKILLQEHATKKAVELATKISGLKKNRLYKLALQLEKEQPKS